MVRKSALVPAIIGLLFSATVAAEVEVSVSPEPMVVNESCRITFRLEGGAAGDPDFSPLSEHFEILARKQQSALNWINGQREQSTTWTLDVMPRAAGSFDIPAINFGGDKTAPLTLTVVEEEPDAPGETPDIIVELTADTLSPYVQQQVILTLRVLHRVELSSPRLSPLQTSGDAIIKALGDGRTYRHRQDGVTYDASEHHYAIFPQQSGTVTIEPIRLTTQVVSGGRRSFFDPFSRSLQSRRVESEPVVLAVRAIPDSFPGGATWLPARRVRIHEEWEPESSSTEVGTPLSRTVFLWAEGLTAGQLPEVDVAAPDGMRIYPDQPQNTERPTDTGYTAVVQQKFALIAGAPGRGTVADITVPWWNTTADVLEYATLPGRELTYTGGVADPVPPGSVAPQPNQNAATPDADSAAVAAPGPWPLLALGLALGWLVTAALWWASSRNRGSTHEPRPHSADLRLASNAQASRALKSACSQHDVDAATDALLAWARGQQPDAAVRTLSDVRACAAGQELRHEIDALNRARYGADPAPWSGDDLWRAFQQEPKITNKPAQNGPRLQPLFRLAGK